MNIETLKAMRMVAGSILVIVALYDIYLTQIAKQQLEHNYHQILMFMSAYIFLRTSLKIRSVLKKMSAPPEEDSPKDNA